MDLSANKMYTQVDMDILGLTFVLRLHGPICLVILVLRLHTDLF